MGSGAGRVLVPVWRLKALRWASLRNLGGRPVGGVMMGEPQPQRQVFMSGKYRTVRKGQVRKLFEEIGEKANEREFGRLLVGLVMVWEKWVIDFIWRTVCGWSPFFVILAAIGAWEWRIRAEVELAGGVEG
jgi:hypothetical protein